MNRSTPAQSNVGQILEGIDARSLSLEEGRELVRRVHDQKLIVLRQQSLTPADHVAFCRRLGTPQIYFQKNYHHPDFPEVFVSSNVPENGKKIGVAGTGRYWHTDCQFFDEPLSMTTVLPRQIPTRGRRGTLFIDTSRVLEELPRSLRSIVEGRRARHEAKWRYKIQPSDVDKSITEILEEFGRITPPVTHPCVLQHPVTGRHHLYISEGFTVGLEGLRDEDAKPILAEIFAFMQRPEFVHTHAWELGDVLLWDNRSVLHMASASEPGEPSVSHRVGFYDGLPFYVR